MIAVNVSDRCRARVAIAALLLVGVLVTAGLPATATASAPGLLLRMPEGRTAPGSGAGELSNARSLAGDPNTGHVYLAELENARVSEYTAWGLFVKSWGWGVADGSAELQTCGPPEPETEPEPALCRKALFGTGAGQFASFGGFGGAGLGGMAVDAAGAVWVGDLDNHRIQKFSSAGEFLLMIGGGVNKTTGADVCTQGDLEDGEECGKGAEGTGPSHLPFTLGDVIAYSPTANTIFVGDNGRIQEFNLDGSFKSQIAFEAGLEAFKGKSVSAMDADPAGNLYMALGGTEGVYELSPTGALIEPPFEGIKKPGAVAVDANGNLYANETPGFSQSAYVLGFDSARKPIPGMEHDDEFAKGECDFDQRFCGFGEVHDLVGIATNFCEGSAGPNLYALRFNLGIAVSRSYVSAYGPPPIGCEPPPPRPPRIEAQYASSVGSEEATLKAQINPLFWEDTTYYVQYGTGKCSEGGCENEQPAAPGAKLTSQATNSVLTTSGVFLAGLEPGTTYRYRFVAESGGGAAVGEERSFTTFASPAPIEPCPNDAFRSGPSAHLPDCRAYEMVSPVDKLGGDAGQLPATVARFGELNQAGLSGERFTYSSMTAFADPESTPYVSQYLAHRGPSGWSSEAISPPRTARSLEITGSLSNEFKAFSPDLCTAWFRHNSVSTLSEDAVAGYPNLYRRRNCGGAPQYEALTTVKPPNRLPEDYFELLPQGFSSDGTHTIFVTDDKLHPHAPTREAEELLLYEHTPAGLRFVCYLPNGSPSPQACSAGTAAGTGGGRQSSLQNAISADGSRIFWTAYSGLTRTKPAGHPGQIYVRIDGAQTLPVSRSVPGSDATDSAWFWGAAEDGSKAIFSFASGSLERNLYEFDVEKALEGKEAARLIAKAAINPMGMSEDASEVYFASREELAPGASKGAANLYHYEAGEEGGEGSFTLIGILSGADLFAPNFGVAPVDLLPSRRAAAVSADGRHAAFTSRAALSGYDNADAVSGEADAEAYLYDAEEDELRCVSCNPTNARPSGENVSQSAATSVWAAARVPAWEYAQQRPRVLSPEGNRLFFESHEALVARDTNAAWDVYQWEAPGTGSCDQADPTYGELSGGCVELISSGESPKDSKFLDADASGEDVFIATLRSLVPSDPGLIDVYDARVGGGFPEFLASAECEGETCQSPPPPPEAPAPASISFQGPGNPANAKPRRRCPKGKRRVLRRGKPRCQKRPGKNRKRSERRGGRKGR